MYSGKDLKRAFEAGQWMSPTSLEEFKNLTVYEMFRAWNPMLKNVCGLSVESQTFITYVENHPKFAVEVYKGARVIYRTDVHRVRKLDNLSNHFQTLLRNGNILINIFEKIDFDKLANLWLDLVKEIES